MLLNKKITSTLILFLGILLTACGGGSDDVTTETPVDTVTPPTTQAKYVTGTAATGAPIVGDIELIDAQNTSSGAIQINQDGSYSIEVTDLTAPFLLRTTDLDGNNLHALATGEGVTNVTELTELALFLMEEVDPSELYLDWVNYVDSVDLEQLASDLAEAAEEIFENFGSIFTTNNVDVADFNIFNTPFNADGSGFDGVLDALDIEINSTAASVAEALQITVSGTPFSWTIDAGDIDFNNDGNTGDITGNWTLTVTVNGIASSSFVITNIAAPDTGDLDSIRDVVIEQAGNDTIANIQIVIIEDSPTRKEFDITYDVSVEANGITINQSFSVKYVYELN